MCAGVSSTRRHGTILKRDSKQVFSCQLCEILKKSYFGEHLRTAASLIYSQHVFTLCQRYGGRASGDVYVDTSPIKHLRWSFLLKKPVAIFLKSSALCLKYVWNGSEYDSASLENTNNLSSKKESGSNKNYYENVYDEDCFLEKVLERSENSKNHLHKK